MHAAAAAVAAATLHVTDTRLLPRGSAPEASILSHRPSGAGSCQSSIFFLMSSSIPFILIFVYALCRHEAEVPGAMPRTSAISLWLIRWKT